MQLTDLITSYLPKIFKSRIAQEGDQDSPVDSSTDTSIPSVIAGFTPIFSNPRASGGKSVSRRDMNGFLKILSEAPYFLQLLGQIAWRREIAGITVASTAAGTGPVQEFTPGCGWELDNGNQTFQGYPRCSQVFWGGYSWESQCDNNHCEPGNTAHKQEYVDQKGTTVKGTNPWKKLFFDELKVATSTTLGGIKVGSNLTIDASTGKLDSHSYIDHPDYSATPVEVYNNWVADATGYILVMNEEKSAYSASFQINKGDVLQLVGVMTAHFYPSQREQL